METDYSLFFTIFSPKPSPFGHIFEFSSDHKSMKFVNIFVFLMLNRIIFHFPLKPKDFRKKSQSERLSLFLGKSEEKVVWLIRRKHLLQGQKKWMSFDFYTLYSPASKFHSFQTRNMVEMSFIKFCFNQQAFENSVNFFSLFLYRHKSNFVQLFVNNLEKLLIFLIVHNNMFYCGE